MTVSKALLRAARAEMRPFVPPNDDTLRSVLQVAIDAERERCDAILREEWHAAVAKHDLQPGSPTEEFAAKALNRVRGVDG